jgi:hypothetical protein
VQCEDLYELISCLLPEVTASPAQHCTYQIFGTNSRGFDPYFLPFCSNFFAILLESRRSKGKLAFVFGMCDGRDIMLFGKWHQGCW